MTQPRSAATRPRSPLPTAVYGRRPIRRPVDASIAIAKPRRPSTPERSVGIGVAARSREKTIAGRNSHERAKTKRMRRAMNGAGLLQKLPVRHARRAHRLARSAPETLIDVLLHARIVRFHRSLEQRSHE